MTIDPETLMAYADGECDPLTTARVERAIAADPELAAQVAAHRTLGARLTSAFAPVAEEPVPARLAAPLATNVVAFPRRAPRRFRAGWAGAIAASLVVGLMLGRGTAPVGPIAAGPGGLVARATLASALDSQLGSQGVQNGVRMVASFKARDGAYCRVFDGRATSGIACRDDGGWSLRQTVSGHAETGAYRQAGSADVALLAQAQDMMAGAPLDQAGEAAAAAKGWR